MGLRASDLGAGSAVVYQMVREVIPFIERDVVLSPLIEQSRQLVAGGAIKRAVEQQLGME